MNYIGVSRRAWLRGIPYAGSGYFSSVHKTRDGNVHKLFSREDAADAYLIWVAFCMDHPNHPNLPRIHRAKVVGEYARIVMEPLVKAEEAGKVESSRPRGYRCRFPFVVCAKRYEEVGYSEIAAVIRLFRKWLCKNGYGPVAMHIRNDLHGGNVMRRESDGALVLTDPVTFFKFENWPEKQLAAVDRAYRSVAGRRAV